MVVDISLHNKSPVCVCVFMYLIIDWLSKVKCLVTYD